MIVENFSRTFFDFVVSRSSIRPLRVGVIRRTLVSVETSSSSSLLDAVLRAFTTA